MDISFAWTTPALLAGKKTVTRRDWSDDYAQKFPVGSFHNATNKQRRFGGKTIGRIKIVSIRREPLLRMLDDPDYGAKEIELEGGLWDNAIHFVSSFCDKTGTDYVWRIEFEFEPVATEVAA